MNCRGPKERKRIVANYDVEPVAHIKLLNGQVIHSDAGGDITDRYFLFRCTENRTGRVKQICCGTPTAMDFSKLTGKGLPSIFNPLRVTGSDGGDGGGGKSGVKPPWNPVRKQLYDATMLIIVAWNAKLDSVLYSIKEELEKDPEIEPCMGKIKSINTILRKGNTTMRQTLNRLGQKNDMKEYSFDLLIKKLEEVKVQQYFE